MKFFLILSFASFLLVSCQKSFKVEEHNVEALNAKRLPEPDNEIHTDTFYNPDFWNTRYLYSEFELVNLTGQTLEKIFISPSLEISFDNELDYNMPLVKDSIIENLNSGKKIKYDKLFSLDPLTGFKEEILLHKARKARLKIEIEGTNSIGFNSAKEDSFVYERDITDEWNFLHSFYRDGKYREAIEVYFNYSDQLNSSITTLKTWDEEFLITINRGFQEQGNVNFRYLENSESEIRKITDYQDLLYSEFYKDLNEVVSLSTSLESNWKNFLDSKKKMSESRRKINSEWKGLQKFKDSLSNLNPYPPRYTIKADGEWITKQEHKILVTAWEEKNEKLFEAVPPIRYSHYQRITIHQENLNAHKKEALDYYGKFQEEMVEVLEMEEFMDSYLKSHRIF